MNWLTNNLKQDIKKVFEERYKRKLSEKEVLEIAINLTEGIKTIGEFLDKDRLKKSQVIN